MTGMTLSNENALLCRTDSDASIIGATAAITGASKRLATKAFNALRREGERHAVATPTADIASVFLGERRDLLRTTSEVGEALRLLHKIGLAQAREVAETGEVPDGPTWHAWTHLLSEIKTRLAFPRREAVIFDIDGTLSNNIPMKHVPLPPPGPEANYDEWMSHTVDLDPNDWVRDATHEVGPNVEKIVLTARSEKYRALTEAWLARHNVAYDRLIMRPNDDSRPDHEYKQQVLDEIEREFDVVFAIDDNPHVTQMWRDNDLATIVVPGFAHEQAPPPPSADELVGSGSSRP